MYIYIVHKLGSNQQYDMTASANEPKNGAISMEHRVNTTSDINMCIYIYYTHTYCVYIYIRIIYIYT